jgi:predicted nucleic acid-binding protein
VATTSFAVLVDSNVLIDVVSNDPIWSPWSNSVLKRTLNEGLLIINPLVYAEVSASFDSIEAVEDALPRDLYRRDDLPYEAAFLAGRAFREYRRRGGGRRSPLPDFYIGAHAAIAGYRLLTRDARRFRTYFPTVELISPDSPNN